MFCLSIYLLLNICCFHLWAIVNSALWTLEYKYLLEHPLSPRSGIAGACDNFMLHPVAFDTTQTNPIFIKLVHLDPWFFWGGLDFLFLFILFLAVLGLHCCALAFSSCGERGLLFVAVRRLLIAVASLVAEHGL